MAATNLADDQYLTAKQVRARYGDVSNTWLFRRMRDAGFPQPASRFGGRSRFWLLSELLAWEQGKLSSAAP
jgi:predicted DNA-binding transcriptional regulator AlpA